jgi:4-amino-4-deoxy-L-arabinose transferase-like glycosyltransferase
MVVQGNNTLPRFLDGLWLLLLAAYVFAGMPLATFHGDEAMQIYMSHDYATAFIYKEPHRLVTSPPYYIDSDQQLRLLNGSINRYAIGLSWHLAGLTTGDLPPAPGWDWGLDYATNVQTNHRPSDVLLNAARLSSTLFLALSAAVLFGIGWQFGGRPLAYVASGLYILNPVVLLNGRRAMMEGSLLCFGLLTILLAVIISRKREQGARGLLPWWIGLTLAGGLTLASKHSGLVFVAGAFGWILVTELARRNMRGILTTTLMVAVSLAVVLAIFLALSPALWNDPIARLQDLIAERQKLIDIQVEADPIAPTTLIQRIEAILAQPFLAPPMHYEVAFWANAEPITAEINRYMASPLSGVQFGWLLGLPLTLLAGLGIVSCVWPGLRPQGSAALSLGLLVWLAVTLLSLLVNPLPWQRYYLPLYPAAALLAGVGLQTAVRLIVQKRKQNLAPTHLPVGSS